MHDLPAILVTWGLRDYGLEPSVWDGEGEGHAWRGSLGLEPTPEMYVEHIVEVMGEVRRVMRKDGTLWLNMGDSYASSPSGNPVWKGWQTGGIKDASNYLPRSTITNGLKPKDLILMPARIALALQADGWWLRSDIIWAKPNPMPESVTDRPTTSHEHLFLLTKAPTYYYDADAIREPHLLESIKRDEAGYGAVFKGRHTMPGEYRPHSGDHRGFNNPAGRNKRSVWTIATQPYRPAHFATFPEALVRPCILAGTSEKGVCAECGAPWKRVVERTTYTPPVVEAGIRNVDASRGDKTRKLSGSAYNAQVTSETTGWSPTCDHGGEPVPATVLDPFGGSCTVGVVAQKLGRKAVMVDLNADYLRLGQERLAAVPLPLGI